MVLLLVIDSWNDYRTLAEITNEAYDSALLEPARLLESSIEFDEQGQVQVVAPLYAQVMLESRAGLRKYFRVEEIKPPLPEGSPPPTPPGRVLLGMPDMPKPPIWPSPNGQPVFFDGIYRNDPVRIVAILRDLYYRGRQHQVLIRVAESVGKRTEVEQGNRRQEILRDARMLVLVVGLVWWGVMWALRPLGRLRNDIRSRSADDLTPLDASKVPVEVVPLVEAVNYHIERHRRILDEQSRFLADASHQLRTPLAIMLTQAQYALREPDPKRVREGLSAIVDQLHRMRRLTEQLLSLAHASQAERVDWHYVDLNHLARQVVLQYLPLAHDKRQDLGWEGEPESGERADEEQPLAVQVVGNEAELHEALSNLVHNAIHYAPPGAHITVSVARRHGRAEVVVSDNGPGLSSERRVRAFARFDRAHTDKSPGVTGSGSGSGLGLSIAQAYAQRNGGDIELRDGEPNATGGVGLASVLCLPLAPDTGATSA